METVEEFVRQGRAGRVPKDIWLHGLDCLSYILKADRMSPIFNVGRLNPYVHFRDELIPCLDEWKAEDILPGIVEESFRPERKIRYRKSDTGELDIARYVGGDDCPFDEAARLPVEGSALSILLDGQVSYADRGLKDMAPRHAKIYRLALQAEAEGRPCRVVAVERANLVEWGKVAINVVIKDWEEPVFRGIWGAFQSNRTANCFLNCFYTFIVGTSSHANGDCLPFNAAGLYNADEAVVIDGRNLRLDPNDMRDRDLGKGGF